MHEPRYGIEESSCETVGVSFSKCSPNPSERREIVGI